MLTIVTASPTYQQPPKLLLVPPEDVLLTTREICMHLTGQQRILRNIRPARVFVQGQEEKPDNADDNAKEREEVREADEEDVRVTP